MSYDDSLTLVAQYREKYNSEFFCLDDSRHAYLCRTMATQVSISGAAEKHICLSTKAFPKYTALLRSFKSQLTAGHKLIHFGMANQIDRQEFCQIIAGYFIRNFKTSRIVRVETLVNINIEYDQDPEVLIIPDFNSIISDNRRSFFAKNTRLSTILVDRYTRGKITITGYSKMEDLVLAITPEICDLIKNNGSQI